MSDGRGSCEAGAPVEEDALRFSIRLVVSLALWSLTPSCSTSSVDAPQGAGMPCVDSGGAPPTPSLDTCATPGTVGNEKGIGAYCIGDPCQPGSVACPTIDGGPQLLCTWPSFLDREGYPLTICISICKSDAECGTDATCIQADGTACPDGSNLLCACVPGRCLTQIADASAGDATADSR